MLVHKIVSLVVSKIKGEDFNLDENIPFSYLFMFIVRKFFALLNGFFVFRKVAFVASSAIIRCKGKIKFGANLSIDRNCFIDALSENGIVFGDNVSIGKNTVIECSGSMKELGKGLVVGNNVGLGTHGFFGCAGGIQIGNDVILGNYVSMHSENHNYDRNDIPIRLQGVNRKGIIIGNDCWIGAKVTFLDGVELGNGCIVAAGAVVRGNFPDNSIIGGVPAKVIKNRI